MDFDNQYTWVNENGSVEVFAMDGWYNACSLLSTPHTLSSVHNLTSSHQYITSHPLLRTQPHTLSSVHNLTPSAQYITSHLLSTQPHTLSSVHNLTSTVSKSKIENQTSRQELLSSCNCTLKTSRANDIKWTISSNGIQNATIYIW